MPTPTAQQRIKQILDLAKGNRTQAETLIRQQVDRDPHFLRQLVEPHLRGIIAHALSREPAAVASPTPVKPLSDDSMNALLRGLQDQSGAAPVAKPSGPNHADTMRAIAEAHKQRRS